MRENMEEVYDVLIIGGGPAGYTAGIYCGRYELKTLIVAKERGGLIARTTTWRITRPLRP